MPYLLLKIKPKINKPDQKQGYNCSFCCQPKKTNVFTTYLHTLILFHKPLIFFITHCQTTISPSLEAQSKNPAKNTAYNRFQSSSNLYLIAYSCLSNPADLLSQPAKKKHPIKFSLIQLIKVLKDIFGPTKYSQCQTYQQQTKYEDCTKLQKFDGRCCRILFQVLLKKGKQYFGLSAVYQKEYRKFCI